MSWPACVQMCWPLQPPSSTSASSPWTATGPSPTPSPTPSRWARGRSIEESMLLSSFPGKQLLYNGSTLEKYIIFAFEFSRFHWLGSQLHECVSMEDFTFYQVISESASNIAPIELKTSPQLPWIINKSSLIFLFFSCNVISDIVGFICANFGLIS